MGDGKTGEGATEEGSTSASKQTVPAATITTEVAAATGSGLTYVERITVKMPQFSKDDIEFLF